MRFALNQARLKELLYYDPYICGCSKRQWHEYWCRYLFLQSLEEDY